MKNYIKNIALAAVILGSLTSCVAYTDGYANNDQNSYYNPSFNNGYYYAPDSYYGSGGYYANDGYYYRDNMSYQYDNNVPYYYGQNRRKIYLQRQTVSQRQVVSQRPENGLQEPARDRVRNNAIGQSTQNNSNRSQNTDQGFRRPAAQEAPVRVQQMPTRNQSVPARSERSIEIQPTNNARSGVNNSGGFRTTETPQNSNRSENTDSGRR